MSATRPGPGEARPYIPVDLVEVRAWGQTVGAATRDPATQAYAFEYDPTWARDQVELAPLHMPNRVGDVYVFPNLNPDTFYRLPPLLADALPDRFGNAVVDAWLAARGIPADQISPLDRLAYQGERGMGALTFHPPADVPGHELTAIQLADLVVAARATVRGEFTDHDAALDTLRQLVQVGTSAGGARAKAVIAYHPETQQIRSGQFDAPDGYEHWLVKLDGVDADATRESDPFTAGAGYGRVEYAYHLMAGAAGVHMEPSRLLREGERTHFLTRRFDRGPAGERHHVVSLCGLAHLDFNLARTHGYEQYLQAIDALGLDAAAREQAYRRIVFNVATVNRDDHTKNLAFLRPEGGDWQLAPAYDVTHAHNPAGRWTHAHQMSVNGRFDEVTLDDLHTLADQYAVPGYKAATHEVLAAVADWPTYAEEAGVDPAHRDRVTTDMERYRPR